MALFIETKNSSLNCSFTTHVGRGIINVRHHAIYDLEIQADGNELQMCEKILGRTIPGPVHIFVGESAKEILLNWNRYNVDKMENVTEELLSWLGLL